MKKSKVPESVTRKLIEAVREYPVIYDKRHPDFQNPEKKAEAWEKISITLNLTIKAVKRRWKRIEDRYMKHKQAVFFGIESSRYKDWFWYKELPFLDALTPVRRPLIKVRETPQTPAQLSHSKLIRYTKNVAKLEAVPPLQKDEMVAPAEMSSQTEQDLGESSTQKKFQLRGIDLLFKSYAETFKSFSPTTQIQLKRKMAIAFSHAELRDLEGRAAINENSPSHSRDGIQYGQSQPNIKVEVENS